MRKPKAAAPAEPDLQPQVEQPAVAAPAPVAPVPVAPAPPAPAPAHAPAPAPAPAAAAPQPAAPAADATVLPSGDYGWLTANFDPNAVPDAMPTIAAPPVSLPAQPVEPTPLPDVPPVRPPEVEVPAVQPPPVAVEPARQAPAENVPFWKKELSFSRAPKQPKAAKPAKEPKAAKEPKGESVPFWKKELGKPKTPKAPKEPKAAKEPKGESVPFWKRELGKPKAPKTPKEPKAAKEPKGESVPFWKKEFGKPKAAKGGKVKDLSGPTAPVKGELVGLKIGASQIAAARVSTSNGVSQLHQYARATLQDGVVVSGELRDVETLARTLKELFAKHKLPKKAVRLGIANNRIGVRTFEIGGIDDPKQLANAIRFRAQETLPIPLEEAVLDWQILSERTDPETGITTRRVLLVVAYRELVDQYVAACRKAGIRLTGIDLEAFAMLRALAAPERTEDEEVQGAQVTVNIGHQRSTFAVSAGKICEFTRVLGWGGGNFDAAIGAALEITPAEASVIKHALSLVAQIEPPPGVSPETLATARDAVLRELQAFARELVSSLRFYQNQPDSLGIAEVVLTGGSAHLPGFAEELHRLIGVPVRVGDPLNRVAVPKRFHAPDDYALGSLTVAIGLGIDD
ncbi:MAG TPA: type IV pilus assembly protein PilM [Gaiellaceae bacterium]|nr:type IV pilus assembly protein PilM [Gaiellaceae bacterium]